MRSLSIAVALLLVVVSFAPAQAGQWSSPDGRECYSSGIPSYVSVGQEAYRSGPRWSRSSMEYRNTLVFEIAEQYWNEKAGELDYRHVATVWVYSNIDAFVTQVTSAEVMELPVTVVSRGACANGIGSVLRIQK